jgi:hypothetical protein
MKRLRLYKTPSEVVHGTLDLNPTLWFCNCKTCFDVDCCGLVLYDSKVWLTERCLYALVNGYNTVSFDRLSPSYEHRLAKYGTRGIAICIPDFNKFGRVVLERRSNKKGLATLLYYESWDKKHKQTYKLYRKEYKLSDYESCAPSINRMLPLDYYAFDYRLEKCDRPGQGTIISYPKKVYSKYLLISNPYVRDFYEVACKACLLPMLFELTIKRSLSCSL